MTLEQFFKENPKAALGFSGGTDSAYLLYAGVSYGADIRPYYIRTPFQPAFEFEDAKRLADELGVEMKVIELTDLSGDVEKNPPNRCYYCKRRLFGILCREAKKDGYSIIIDGTNASDDAADRPGMQALAELSVRSPLRESGLTKDEIRQHSKKAGLFTWNKPAYACLATRIPYGTQITKELLQRIEAAEMAMNALGFTDFRVRMMDDKESAKLQVKEDQMEMVFRKRKEIQKELAPYFKQVMLDFKVR